jgi:hypothetical protein
VYILRTVDRHREVDQQVVGRRSLQFDRQVDHRTVSGVVMHEGMSMARLAKNKSGLCVLERRMTC